MPINPSTIIPAFCKNCAHRFVCSIQETIREQEADVKKFNEENKPLTQSISATSYICHYKLTDTTV